MYSSKDSPSGMVFLGSSETTGFGSRVWASPPMDHPISCAISPLEGFGFGSTWLREVTNAGLTAGAKAEAEAKRAKRAAAVFCSFYQRRRKADVRSFQQSIHRLLEHCSIHKVCHPPSATLRGTKDIIVKGRTILIFALIVRQRSGDVKVLDPPRRIT
jgi:hypothetical protein